MPISIRTILLASTIAALGLVPIGAAAQQQLQNIEVRQSGKAVLDPSEMARRALPYWNAADGASHQSVGGIDGVSSELVERADASGLQATLTVVDGRHVLAFSGTNFELSKEGLKDILSDIQLGIGLIPKQFKVALDISKSLSERYPDLMFAGYSLGGGIAQYVAVNTNRQAVVFNAAGDHSYTANKGDSIINIRVAGELVGNLGGQQLGTEYDFSDDDTLGPLSKHMQGSLTSALETAAGQHKQGTAVNWAAVEFSRGNMAAVISGNVSATGSAGGTVSSGSKSQAVASGLFVGNTELAETEWTLTAGNPAIHLGQGTSYGPIVADNHDGSIIYSLNNADVERTSIEKTFAVGASGAKISLSGLANFVTTEFPDFVDTEFNDNASVTLITQNGRSVTVGSAQLFGASVNDSHFSPVSGLPSPLAGVNPDNGGGTTDWSKLRINNLKVAAGGTLKVVVTVNNVGDTAYPSAILLNKLQAK